MGSSGLSLVSANIAFSKKRLTLKIAQFDMVVIDKNQSADTRPGKIGGACRPKRSLTDNSNGSSTELFLSVTTDKWENHLSAVALGKIG